MGKIKILPQKIANKIAAGEVVERPASVVKELLENAVDAGATQIKVEIEKGGIKTIRVVDNGVGMDAEDLKNCIRRHGTSKIKTEEDLRRIKSLGFRGEALSSVAAVSRMVIESKIEEEAAGTRVEIEDGGIQNIQPVGIPRGTSVTVRDLFYNTPARKKFLKSTPTEFRQISETVADNALSFTNIGFTLIHNGRTVFDFPKNQPLRERIRNLLGPDINDHLLEIFFDHPHLEIKGFVAKPQVSSSRPHKQYTFVNNRRVKDRTVAAAARNAYGTLLPAKTYPIFIAFLRLPYEMVDVNVHPRKEEVKFVSQNFIYNSVKNAVSTALQKGDLTFRTESIDRFKKKSSIGPRSVITERRSVKHYKQALPWETRELRSFERSFEDRREILQVHNLYLITETAEGLAIFDQHAAHERILFESLLEEFKKEKKQKNIQPLLVAETIDLSLSDAEILKENRKVLEKLGFEISPFGKNSFKINCVPTILKSRNPAALIGEIIEDLREDGVTKDVDQKSLRAISFLACRSAVKAGDSLPKEERQSIVDQLEETKTKYTCPHGRPVKVEISLKELEKMFKRR
jgi:DNA mismatch repair protein MutL